MLLDPSGSEYVVERPPAREAARQGFYDFLRGGEAVGLFVEVLDWNPNGEAGTARLRGSRLDGTGIAREEVTLTFSSGWACAVALQPEVGDLLIAYVDPVPVEGAPGEFRLAVAVAGGAVPPLVPVDRTSMTAIYPWGTERAADLLDPWSVR